MPRGAGTGLACGAVPIYGGVVLSLEKMNKIIEVNADAMYAVVEPGVRTSDLQAAAEAKGAFYAGDPCSADSCLIGGNIATNAGGNKAVRYGTTRDQVYAIEAVTPTGDIVNVGARLKKKSTGYCLEQLIMGSEGNGISRPLRQYVNRQLLIPRFPADREGAESLNVAVATALTCAEFRRRQTWK